MTLQLLAPTIVLLAWLFAVIFFERPKVGTTQLNSFLYPAVLATYIVIWATVDTASDHVSLINSHQKFVAYAATFLTAVWLISLAKRDTSIMDIAYPLTAAIPVLILLSSQQNWSTHELILCTCVTLWSVRLAAHIGIRNLPEGEDARYASWRRRFSPHWWWWSLFQVFTLQGVLVSLWSVPLILAVDAKPQGIGVNHFAAIALFAVGFYFQTVADYQLEQFRKTRRNREELLDRGLWARSRHPNYFGECLIWWSFGLLGLSHDLGFIGLLAPVYVTWFMARGSATPMQEKYLAKKKPGYAKYAAEVPEFFPRFKI
ncbi:MAG: DUF1295 domain-containing protein [Proteobacteria bacterium]|nr:DUF1295 domain-containing protein [Pseudomonadota bacterium]